MSDASGPVGTPGGELVVDARGERCPVPVIRLARLVRERAGDLSAHAGPVVVTVLATDPAAATDVPAWCRMRGHRFVTAMPAADHTAYVVEVANPSTPRPLTPMGGAAGP
ncbi:MAG: SirA-like protein [Humibacillus sp.]|nr:SirA-like protein [Humibacillus sp.]